MQSHHSRSEHRESLISTRNYKLWGQMVAQTAKTPRNLEKPRAEYSDLEIAGYVMAEHREDIIRLWETFTTDRAEVSRYLMDPKRESLVYLIGFHLANQARLASVLDRTEFRHKLLSQLSGAEAVHLMDLGCGSGALSLLTAQELWSYREAMEITWEMVDKSQAFLDLASLGIKLLAGDEAKPVLRRQKLDEYLSREVANGAKEGLVWYQLGYVWNEVARHAKTSTLLLRLLEAGLKQGQRVLTILEPASEDMALEAMKLRDRLTEMGYVMLYPCPHSQACPMLETARDWCYSEAVWDRPPLIKKVDKILKIDRQRIGVSAYVFVSPDLIEEGHIKMSPTGSVVVGRPVEKAARDPRLQQKSYLLCEPEVDLGKIKIGKGTIELLRGQVYRDVPVREKKVDPDAEDKPKRGPQKPRNPSAMKKRPMRPRES
ncbi:MAG: hypothetical protein EOP10_12645 [Proteobacteria bacterium]|nr:MAG: hypothetical protein EOP10_12645 [Pseudomonadota bacterium]